MGEHENFSQSCPCFGTAGVAENGGMSHATKIYGKVVSSMKRVEFGWDTSQPLHYMSTAPCIFVIILMNNVSSCFQMGEPSGGS